jgi:hypothetical protein
VKALISKILKIDNILIVVSLIFFLLSSLLFSKYESWILEPRIFSGVERTKAGTIVGVNKVARRRYAGSMTYFGLSNDKIIYEGDTLFTEKGSRLEVRLTTETKLKLNELTMLIIDREGSNFKIYMTGGEVDGELAENDKVIFDVDQERIEITGEKGSEFKIKNNKLASSTIEGTKGRVFASYKRKEFDLSRENLQLPQSATESKDSSQSKEQLEASPLASAISVQSEEFKITDLPLDLPIPYPPNRQLLLLKRTASLVLVPKRKCEGECELSLLKMGQSVGKWSFKAGTTPATKIMVNLSDVGDYVVQLQEKTFEKSNSKATVMSVFQLRKFSKSEFENALKQGLSVEVMD